MAVPERRTMIVLGSLVGAMTVASGLLLLFEPGPTAPRQGVSLNVVDTTGDRGESLLFATNPPPQAARWSSIIIHASGTPFGSAQSINRVHERLGRGGLGYHFVVNNGSGAEDGLIEVGFRWRHQYVGAYQPNAVDGPDTRRAIGVCLIGDGDAQSYSQVQMRELLWLVQRLQGRFEIPVEHVMIQMDAGPGQVGKLFPIAQFRRQLLRPTLGL